MVKKNTSPKSETLSKSDEGKAPAKLWMKCMLDKYPPSSRLHWQETYQEALVIRPSVQMWCFLIKVVHKLKNRSWSYIIFMCVCVQYVPSTQDATCSSDVCLPCVPSSTQIAPWATRRAMEEQSKTTWTLAWARIILLLKRLVMHTIQDTNFWKGPQNN